MRLKSTRQSFQQKKRSIELRPHTICVRGDCTLLCFDASRFKKLESLYGFCLKALAFAKSSTCRLMLAARVPIKNRHVHATRSKVRGGFVRFEARCHGCSMGCSFETGWIEFPFRGALEFTYSHFVNPLGLSLKHASFLDAEVVVLTPVLCGREK